MNAKICIIALLTLLLPTVAMAQESAWSDTLKASVMTDYRGVLHSINKVESNVDFLREVVSPMGQGDPIRWSQRLPGVTAGADGSSAMYVHGGNMGNNLFSLDGVPVYGYSHILGLTTTIPTEVIGSASLSKGGVEGRYGNFTAAHLNVTTRDPATDKVHGQATINNFLAGASVEAPLKHGMSFMFSARVSPIGLEYKLFHTMLPSRLGSLQDFNASVGDVYGKFNWKIDERSNLTASTLLSQDHYSFTTSEASRDAIGWNNEIAVVKYQSRFDWFAMDVQAYINRNGTMQCQEKNYHGKDNILALNSSMMETSLSADFSSHTNSSWDFDYGIKGRYCQFKMGDLNSNTGKGIMLMSAYVQADFVVPDKLFVDAVLRTNYFRNIADGKKSFNPDASLSLKWALNKAIAFEGSADYVNQFYHTLEGLPLGWSSDVIVPVGRTAPQEQAFQGNLGMHFTLEHHSLSLGGYYKLMNNLVYYKYAQTLFTDAFASWERNVDIGKGISYGGEFLYEYANKHLYTMVSYTLSKTDRMGFATILDGGRFNAKFDRRHILNLTGRWKGISIALSLQSGHWENGAPLKYDIHIPGFETVAEYYGGINDFHMPAVFRLDLGYVHTFHSKRTDHTLNLGVCNLTNHFNPFMLYYDTKVEGWKMMALLPILPNFSYRAEF